MRKSIKAIICAASAVVMCAAPTIPAFSGTLAPTAITAEAADDNTATVVMSRGHEIAVYDGLAYDFDEKTGEAKLTGRYAYRTEVKVPATLTIRNRVYKITQINDYAFRNATSITRVDLLRAFNLKTIGDGAFSGTTSTVVKLSPNLQTIGVEAFANTNVKEIKIPYTVTQINSRAFKNCKSLNELQFQSAYVDGKTDTYLVIQSGAFENESHLSIIKAYRKAYSFSKSAFQNTVINSDLVTGMGKPNFLSYFNN